MRTYDLIEAVGDKNIIFKIPLAAMRDVGQASLTLAGLLTITHQETFVSLDKIATAARVPKASVRKHLDKLVERGWVDYKGRGHTRTGAPRRTLTYRVTKKSLDALSEYAVLPWFFRITRTRKGRSVASISWPGRAILAVVLSRLMSLKAVVEREDGTAGLDADDVFDSIDNLGGDRRFKFTLNGLAKLTGLTRPSVISGKTELEQMGVVREVRTVRVDGGDAASLLVPNDDFQVVLTDAETPGRCYVNYCLGAGKPVGTPG